MPRIIFARPAETEFCESGRLLGRFDADLNEKGLRQAASLGEVLRQYQPSFLAASPLKRALATAMAVEYASPTLSTHSAAEFHAMDIGDWEQQTRDTINACDQRRYKTWLTDPDFPAPGGECLREVYARAFPKLLDMVQHAEPDETMVLVLQEGVIKALCCAVLDLPLEHGARFSMGPATYSVFERIFEGGPYQLVAWNRKAHLAEEEKEYADYAEPVAT